MSGIEFNPFSNSSKYPIKNAGDGKKVENQEQTKNVVDVKASRGTQSTPQTVASTDAELVGAYFGFSPSKGVSLDPAFATALKEVLAPEQLAAVQRYNATANETRIKAGVDNFVAIAPVAVEDSTEFKGIIDKFNTPEQRMSIALSLEDFESIA